MIIGICLIFRAVFSSNLPMVARSWRMVLGIFLMIAFKPYVLVCLVPALVFWLATKYVFGNRLIWSVPMFATLLVLLTLAFPGKRADVTHYLTRKQYDFINIGRGGLHAYADTCFFYFRPDQFQYIDFRPDSSVYLKKPLVAKQVTLGRAAPFKDVYLQPNTKRWINYYETQGCASNVAVTPIQSSFKQLLLNIPEALVNGAFRPFFGDPGGMLKYPAILETLLLFGWFILQFRFWNNTAPDQKLLVVTLFVFALSLFILIGWTTPVLGAIVRYRVPAYLAVFLAGILLHRKKRTYT